MKMSEEAWCSVPSLPGNEDALTHFPKEKWLLQLAQVIFHAIVISVRFPYERSSNAIGKR
jgi:hypothetical protein